jgi:hypothetical protein
MQNVPSSDPDGQPDYAGQYEKLDELDTINSVVCRGGKLNLDPTLLLRMEPEAVGSAMVKKGSDHALVTGEKGDGKYLEISGTSLEAGCKLVDRLKQQVMDEAECVVTDPDKVAAGAVAAVALQMVYAPMMSRVSLIRETAGEAMRELLTQILHVCQARWTETVETTDAASGDVTTEEVTNFLMLDPKVEEEEVEDPITGEKTGEVSITIKEREPGTGKRVKLSWGPCFKPNSIDVQNTVTAMSLAVGGKAVLSQRTAVEVVCSVIGKDPKVVMEELDGDHSKELAVNGSMFGLPGGDGMTQPGGKPGEAPQLPAGAPAPADAASLDPEAEFQKGIAKEKAEHPELPDTEIEKLVLDHLEQNPGEYSQPAMPLPGQPASAPVEAPEKPKLSLTSTDLGAIITVNEARAQYGFGAWPDEDGNLSLAEFKVKHGKLVSGSAMADKGQDPNKPPPAAPPAFGGPPGGKPGFGKKAVPGASSAEEPGDGAEPEPGFPPKKKPPFAK